MKQLSIVGKDLHTEEHALGFYTSGDRMKFWAGRGALWGSLSGMLLGSALFLFPAIGPVIVMGPLVAWIASALEGAAVGGATGGAAGALAAALASIGLPKDSVVKYELEVKAGRFLVLVHGSAGLIEQARHLLGTTEATHVKAHVNRSDARDRAQMLLPSRSEATREGHESILPELSSDEIALVDAAARRAHLSDG
jgi:hypothetical protein